MSWYLRLPEINAACPQHLSQKSVFHPSFLRQLEDRMNIEDAEKALADPEGLWDIPAQEVWKERDL